MWSALISTLAGLPVAAEPPKYIRYELHELVLCAEEIVAGEIRSVAPSTFGLRVEEWIVGEPAGDALEVKRFEDWTCAQRWTAYQPGQRVLLFLGPRDPNTLARTILGGGGEGEMPLVGADVIVRGYDVPGYQHGSFVVKDGEAEGVGATAREVFDAIRAFRAALQWELVGPPDVRRPKDVRPRDPELASTFGKSSAMARELLDEARTSLAWKAEATGLGRYLALQGLRRLSALALGCAEAPRPGEPDDQTAWSRFGDALAFVGDVDGDGIVDLAAGAPGDCRVGRASGALWILFLARDGSVRTKTQIGDGCGGFPATLNELAHFGCSLAPLGDLDGDGVPELAVGAEGWDGGGALRGGVWILHLAPDGTVRSCSELGSSAALRAGAGSGPGLGAALAALGDLDGDGGVELAIGQAPDESAAREQGRAVWIVSLGKDEVRWARPIIHREAERERNKSRFGAALAAIGDLDGDGRSELAVADPRERFPGEQESGLSIVFLGADGSVRREESTRFWFGERAHPSLLGPGDLDGDGIPDLMIGSDRSVLTALLDRTGTARPGRRSVVDPELRHRFCVFARSMACSRVGSSRPALAVASDAAKTSEEPRDAFVWFFSIDEAGQIVPW